MEASQPLTRAQAGAGVMNSLQYLRAAAALLVVVYHLEPRLRAMGWVGPWSNGPAAGVDIFFVLSGFLMWTTTFGRGVTPGVFALRRIERIVPLYWITSAAMLAVLLAAPSLVSSSRPDFGEIVGSFLFVAVKNPASGAMLPLIPQGWTLNLEMAFYAIFALVLFLPARLRLWATLGALVLAAGAGMAIRGGGDAYQFYTQDIMLEFGFGVVLGALWTRGLRGSAPLGMALIAVGAVLIALSGGLDTLTRTVKWGLPAALIVGGCLLVERAAPVPSLRFPRLLGDASYSIYLVHGMALTPLALVWRKAGLAALPFSEFLFCLFGVTIAAATGCALYLGVEKPLNLALKRRRRRDPATGTIAGSSP